jgi:hypothetical protein
VCRFHKKKGAVPMSSMTQAQTQSVCYTTMGLSAPSMLMQMPVM